MPKINQAVIIISILLIIALISFFYLSQPAEIGSEENLTNEEMEPMVTGTEKSSVKNSRYLDAGIEAWEDGTRVTDEDNSYEWWYFDGILDDGTIFVISWNINVAAGVRKPSLSVSITWPNGESYYEIYSPHSDLDLQFSSSTGGCDIIIGKNTLKGNLSKYYLHLENLGNIGQLDLELNKTAPSWKIDGIPYHINDLGYLGWLPSVPRGVVSGKLDFNGGERELSALSEITTSSPFAKYKKYLVGKFNFPRGTFSSKITV